MGWPTAGPSVAGFTPGELVDGGGCAIASTSVERITRDMDQRDLGFVARPEMLVPERDRPPVFFHKRRSGQRAAACARVASREGDGSGRGVARTESRHRPWEVTPESVAAGA